MVNNRKLPTKRSEMRRMYKGMGFVLGFFIAVSGYAAEACPIAHDWKLPFKTSPRKSLSSIRWTRNGEFMAWRVRHLHTGIDLTNSVGGPGEEVYAASAGKVVSIYAKEPYLSVMIQHRLSSGQTVWTVYVHVTNVMVRPGDVVGENTVIALLMNESQLNRYGWEFNHLHFEILKYPRINKEGKHLSFSTKCKTENQVRSHFYNPITFLQRMWADEELRDDDQ